MSAAEFTAAAPAADRAAEPTATTAQPADKPADKPNRSWTVRRNEELLLQVWRLIANAGPLGIGSSEICSRLNNMELEVLKHHTHELRRKGHITFSGSSYYGCWVASIRPPLNEQPPIWMRDLGEPADKAEQHNADVARIHADAAVHAAITGATPNSVFALVVSEVDIDKVHRVQDVARRHRAAAAALANAPADAPADAPAAAAAAPAAAPVDPPAPAPVPDPEPLHQAEPNQVYALDNHGRLLIHTLPLEPIVLSPAATAGLFRYLDKLMAIGHGSLSEALR